MFSLPDLILIVLVMGFALFGLFFGLVHAIGSLVGTIVAAIVSGYLLPVASAWVNVWFPVGPWGNIVLFIILFTVISRLVGFAFWMVDKLLGWFTKLPFISAINRLLGFLFGIVEGVAITGVGIHLLVTYLVGAPFVGSIASSNVGYWISFLANPLVNLLPF